MSISLSTICRKSGKVYLRETSGALLQNPQLAVTAFTKDGTEIPVQVDSEKGILALPLVNTPSWKIQFHNPQTGQTQAKTQNCFVSKWKSRLNYRLHPEKCADIQDGFFMVAEKQADLLCADIIPDGERKVARVRAQIPEQYASYITFSFLDCKGNKKGLLAEGQAIPEAFSSVYYLEDGVHCAESNQALSVREVTMSIVLPGSVKSFGVVCEDTLGKMNPGFVWVDEASMNAITSSTQNHMQSAEHDQRYHQWWLDHKVSSEELKDQHEKTFDYMLLISVVVPLYKTPKIFLQEMIESVQNQSYGNWELLLANASPESKEIAGVLSCLNDPRIKEIRLEDNKGISVNTNEAIKKAQGDYIAFFDHDDLLAPNALFEYVKAINEAGNKASGMPILLYCDEDKIDGKGTHSNPFFKPNYSPDLLRAHNYITHFLVVKKSVLDEVGLLNSEFDGAQDYDLTLRVCEKATCSAQIVHIPKVLYHWRLHGASTSMNSDSKEYAKTAGIRAVQAHVKRKGFDAAVGTIENLPFAYKVEYGLPKQSTESESQNPLVSVVIPNKDQIKYLSTCIDSLLNKASYKNLEIVIVENNSCQDETFAYYQKLKEQNERIKVVTWKPSPGEPSFNFSRIANYGVAASSGEYVLLLNNDTEVITPNFIEIMLGYFQDEEVGVVGAKLLYKDRTVQHGGVVVGPFDQASHLFMNMPEDELGYYCRNVLPQNLSAVTGACQLFRRRVFDEVGGYTSEFVVGFNDVDFCLKVRRAGYRITYTPLAKLFHYEFASRGRDIDEGRQKRVAQETKLMHERWPELFKQGDPFVGPNIDRDSLFFGLNISK